MTGFVPDDQFKPDAPGFIPDNEFKPDAPGFVPDDQFKPDAPEKDYSSTGQMIATGLEGAAQGAMGPIAPWLETKLGIATPEDIAGRAQENPMTHGVAEAATLGAGLLTGWGEAGLIAKGAEAAAKAAELGKVGSAVLRGAIEGAAMTTSDEITKALLSKPGSDPAEPASNALLHVGAAGLMGAATGGIFSLGQGIIGKGLESIKNEKVSAGVSKYLAEVGESGDPLGKLGVTKKINSAVSKSVAGGIASQVATSTGSETLALITYEAVEKKMLPIIQKITGYPIGKANKYVAQAFIKGAMENQAAGVPNAIHYAQQIGKGAQKATERIEALFKAGSAQLTPPITDDVRNSLKQFIEDGQVDQQVKNQIQSDATPQPFAHGGVVETKAAPADHFASIFPEQSAVLTAAKSRISGYLNGLRPDSNAPRLPFDPKPLDRDKHRTYNSAIDIAINPMKVLDKVHKGNLTPQDMKHFVSMYPEVHSMLSRKMTERIMKAQLSGEKPSYAKRQAMSLFMGAPLDSTLTPVAIQTAQGVFALKRAAQQAPVKNKKGTSSLGKSNSSYQTAEQSRASRQQKQ